MHWTLVALGCPVSGPPRMRRARSAEAVDVLLVEDNEGDVVLVREALCDAGVAMRLHVARDGIEALDFLHGRSPHDGAPRPDVILLDLNLPRLHGREVLERLESDPALRAIPVVVLSTSADESDIRMCYQRSANLYVTKPADLDEYVRVIQRLRELWLEIAALPGGSD